MCFFPVGTPLKLSCSHMMFQSMATMILTFKKVYPHLVSSVFMQVDVDASPLDIKNRHCGTSMPQIKIDSIILTWFIFSSNYHTLAAATVARLG